MFDLLEIVTVIFAALALVPALAHALELPGKMRLAKDAYFAAQTIYYPGFTIAGIGEPLGVLATFGLLVLMPQGSTGFWLTLIALLGLIGMQTVYWLVTHPVNKVWLRRESLGSVGSGFFSFASAGAGVAQDWTRLRDVWEYSHVARASLAAMSFIALVVAIA
jgi:hypothetical protein